MKIRKILGYSAAALTLVIAVLVPFVLINFLSHGVEAAGLHVDEGFVGGPVVRTIAKPGYVIQVHREFHPRWLQRTEPFVQLSWEPRQSLPAQISDDVDIDGDGKPDVRVSFATPAKDGNTKVNVESLNPKYVALHGVGQQSFSRLIAVIHNKVVVRMPVRD